MNRLELIRQVAGETGLSPAAADAAVRAALDAVAGALARGEAVRLSGFGAFAAKDRPAHAGRNPATGESIVVPVSRSVSFRAGKGLRDAVNLYLLDRCGGCVLLIGVENWPTPTCRWARATGHGPPA